MFYLLVLSVFSFFFPCLTFIDFSLRYYSLDFLLIVGEIIWCIDFIFLVHNWMFFSCSLCCISSEEPTHISFFSFLWLLLLLLLLLRKEIRLSLVLLLLQLLTKTTKLKQINKDCLAWEIITLPSVWHNRQAHCVEILEFSY